MRTYSNTVSVELSSSIARLLADQREDGSVGSDILTTAVAMQGLVLSNGVIHNDRLRFSSEKMYTFLSQWLWKTSAETRSKNEIYADLPNLMSRFGLVALALWSYSPIEDKDLIRAIRGSVRILVGSSNKYLSSLSSPLSVAQMLCSIGAITAGEQSEISSIQNLMEYSMNEITTDNYTITDRSGLLLAFAELAFVGGDAKRLLQASWDRIIRKIPSKNFPQEIQDALLKITSSLASQILSKGADNLSILRCFRTLVVLDPEDKADLQGRLYEKVSEFTLPTATEDGSLNNSYLKSDIVAAYAALALSGSKFAKTISFSSKDEKEVLDAVEVYEDWKRKKIIPLPRRGYSVILGLVILDLGFFLAPILDPGLLTVSFYQSLGVLAAIGTAAFGIFQWALNRLK